MSRFSIVLETEMSVAASSDHGGARSIAVVLVGAHGGLAGSAEFHLSRGTSRKPGARGPLLIAQRRKNPGEIVAASAKRRPGLGWAGWPDQA